VSYVVFILFSAVSSSNSYSGPSAQASPAGNSYGSPSGGNQDTYGSPSSPVASSASAPLSTYGGASSNAAIPSYGNQDQNCEVTRSLTKVGNDCQQGGQVRLYLLLLLE